LEAPGKSTRYLRAAIMGVFGVFLAWQVTSRTLVAYLAEAAPEKALGLRSNDPGALLNLADQVLNAGPTDPSSSKDTRTPASVALPVSSNQEPGRLRGWAELLAKAGNGGPLRRDDSAVALDPAAKRSVDPALKEQIRSWVERALQNDPLSARGFRFLSQLSDGTTDTERTAKLMRATIDRSIRESVAVYWLMQRSLEEKDYALTLYCADALLRTRPQLMGQVAPTLAKLSEANGATQALQELLAKDPPWRGQFFAALPQVISDARTPLAFFLALRDTAHPPTPADLRPYLDVLIRHKFYELAYYTWLQFLPPDQLTNAGQPFNGGFESKPSGLPFDWVITGGNGVTTEILHRPDDAAQHALSIEFGLGRVEFGGVSQLLLLGPGSYTFRANYKAEIVGRRGLVWRVSCATPDSTPLGQSAMMLGKVPTWRALEFTFTVPPSDCPAQSLRLVLDARSASEQLVSGWSWHDDVRIVRDDGQ
jgi:hypothetical protein